MTEAVLKVVVYHTDGHSIWMAPWVVYAWLALIALWAILIILSWTVRR